ncbi:MULTISPECIES: MurR/RpiR family transcriptional regulator [Enterococcus]|uniref:RpiR family transcriptional regulator n=1 Tax=Candidatus Enterococcus ferrettii TaxID=2815324 RepID=A0ABV0ERA7_9ENTE|nr:MurR/RpiR family transcriptional regulator [Enterococcus sp. 665A]MBO1342100.1 MurR/RpiR family transcriptional regulator [Enterococcus sp. 665A]
MSVLSHMDSMKKDMSAAEKKIYRFICDNKETIPTMTASEIAAGAGSSAPTVVRFSKKMGFNSLTAFKISLSAETRQAVEITGYSDVGPNEPFQTLKNKLANNAQFTISETSELFNEKIFNEACHLLESTNFCFVSGVGASRLAADDITQKWTRLGKNIVYETDYNLLLPQLVTNAKQSVLFLISNSGKTPELIALAETAKSLDIPIIALTQFGQNRLSKLADIHLQTSRPMEAEIRSAATNSIIAQFITIDLLFYLYISRNQKYAKKIFNTRQAIDQYRQKYF